MKYLLNKIESAIEFFARDILSLSILFCLFAFLANHFASAETIYRSQSTSLPKAKMQLRKPNNSNKLALQNENPGKNWMIDLQLNAGQKKIENTFIENPTSQMVSIHSESSVGFQNAMNLKAYLNYDSFAKNELQSDISDLLLSFHFYKSKIGSNLTLKTFITSTIPLSKDSKQRQMMNFGSGAGISLVGQTALSRGSLAYTFGLTAHKYFHQYEIAINSFINRSHSSNQFATLEMSLGSFSAISSLRNISSWNYANASKNTLFHTETVGYNVTRNLSFALGYTNAGTILFPTQEEIEIRLVEESSSIAFLSTAYVF